MKKIALLLAVIALVLPATAVAHDRDHGHHRTTQVCYLGKTITIPTKFLQAFLANGATLGVCKVQPMPCEPGTVSSVQTQCTQKPPVVNLPSHTFLCYSHFAGSIPASVEFEQAAGLVAQGWFVPGAVLGNAAGQDNVGAYYLVCNEDGLKATGTGIGGEGDVFGSSAWQTVLVTYGPTHINHYEIYR